MSANIRSTAAPYSKYYFNFPSSANEELGINCGCRTLQYVMTSNIFKISSSVWTSSSGGLRAWDVSKVSASKAACRICDKNISSYNKSKQQAMPGCQYIFTGTPTQTNKQTCVTRLPFYMWAQHGPRRGKTCTWQSLHSTTLGSTTSWSLGSQTTVNKNASL